MEKIRNFRDLKVWQISIDMVTLVYQMLKSFPKEEQYGIMSQIRRSAVSVPANIAEGQARQHTKEYLQGLYIAKGSLAELETHLIISEKLNYLSQENLTVIEKMATQIRMALNGLIKSLKNKLHP